MNTELSTIIQRFMLHCNDAVLSLCLNNGSHCPSEKSNDESHYDSTQENTNSTYQQLEVQLQHSQAQVESKLGKQTAQQIMVILAIHADEAVLTSGLYSNGYLWPKLQRSTLGNKDGGNVFFEYCDELFATSDNDTPQAIYDVLHYCLKNGFKGRYYGNSQALNYYTKQLAQGTSNAEKLKARPKVRAIHEYA